MKFDFPKIVETRILSCNSIFFRGAFIDQSQSLNIHVAEPNYGKLTSMHFYGWKLGLKTGMYYLRTKAAAAAIQFTVDKTKVKETMSAKKDKVRTGI